MVQKGSIVFGLALAACLLQPALSGQNGGTAWALDPVAADSSEIIPSLPRPIPPLDDGSAATPSIFPNGMLPTPIFTDPLGGPGYPPQENGTLGPNGQAVGWFFNLEGAALKPHLNSHINSGSNLTGTPAGTGSTASGAVAASAQGNASVASIRPPIADLNWTGSPYIELGYRLPAGAGDFRLGYQILASQGSQQLDNYDTAGAGLLTSRLNLNRLDFTYSCSDFLTDTSNGLLRDLRAGLGITAVDIFFDSQIQGQQVLHEGFSNSFAGVGPRFLFEYIKPLPKLPVSFYSRLDASGILGKARQHFRESQLVDGNLMNASAAVGPQSDGVALFNVEGGLSWVPSWFNGQSRITLGYRWQRYWWVGATNDSNADLTLQGVFLRGEYRY